MNLVSRFLFNRKTEALTKLFFNRIEPSEIVAHGEYADVRRINGVNAEDDLYFTDGFSGFYFGDSGSGFDSCELCLRRGSGASEIELIGLLESFQNHALVSRNLSHGSRMQVSSAGYILCCSGVWLAEDHQLIAQSPFIVVLELLAVTKGELEIFDLNEDRFIELTASGELALSDWSKVVESDMGHPEISSDLPIA